MWWVIGGVVVFGYLFIFLFIFSAARVAAKADRDIEEWLREYDRDLEEWLREYNREG